jgi:3-methyl-2-oxobutanoate hydroxymethyltransferase
VNQYLSPSINEPLSILDLLEMKQRNEKFTCLTAYDASFSAVLDKAGIDILLVGDSLGMVVQGHASTIPVSITDMTYHCACVSKARQRSFIVADLPFMSYSTENLAGDAARQLMQQGGAQMVKLEGPRYNIIRFLIDQGVPVCGHLGLLPQSINLLGKYRVQGKTKPDADKLLEQANQIQAAGATLLVLECIPAELARLISAQLTIPVIGIGAGVDCDGQVLVLYDMLDISVGKKPRFSKNYLKETQSIEKAVLDYIDEVKRATFPAPEHSF